MAIQNLCGKRILELRKRQKLNQIDIVTALQDEYNIKMDSTVLGRIERNERGVWDFELLALSKVLNVDVGWLLEGNQV